MAAATTANSISQRRSTIAEAVPRLTRGSSVPDLRPAHLPPVVRARLAYLPAEAGISVDEWHAFVASNTNVLVVGLDRVLARVWTAAWPALSKPVCWTDSANFWLPHEAVPTLVLQDVDALNSRQQASLLVWLNRDAHAT